MNTDNSPVALIEVQSMEDISILINDDPTIEDVDTEVNQFMQALLSNESELDSLLELWGFWVDDVNRSSLMEGIRRQYNSPTQLIKESVGSWKTK
jgi:hypothetical protein